MMNVMASGGNSIDKERRHIPGKIGSHLGALPFCQPDILSKRQKYFV
jgi:hypothetical protein